MLFTIPEKVRIGLVVSRDLREILDFVAKEKGMNRSKYLRVLIYEQLAKEGRQINDEMETGVSSIGCV
ncbi:hypothetical protein DNHGIG_40060 [Collibacillus ludicampi]|uniref:Ribbon-helix-helix protein CopG domain-containing protein n=1 Tax=Collibacillus ludicampi TaxID=2771369 RepID=A0AAV4LKT9_9BACL|nr:hypothetical protein [Collibacillus ludicampi]GIM48457.1 hypothetical protein DNHGIG_40060 [Collibacillus ludicampi]